MLLAELAALVDKKVEKVYKNVVKQEKLMAGDGMGVEAEN